MKIGRESTKIKEKASLPTLDAIPRCNIYPFFLNYNTLSYRYIVT